MDRSARHDWIALVVDDDVFVVSALAEMLSEQGFDVHTASNGFSAMRQAVECHPTLVLLDLVLPERSGIEVLHDLRAEPATREVAIVVVTAHPEMLSEAQIGETDGVVGKPFDVDELLMEVQRATQRASSRTAEVAPVIAAVHHEAAARPWRVTGVRRTRGRR
jgi:DNA-binding response OmpR family regulator